MDKFTKTTEVDISNMGLIEEETPQKSKVGKIIAIIVSLLISISVWLYVVETDDTDVEEIYDNISVSIDAENADYIVIAQKVSVIITGTNSELVDIDESDIFVEIDASDLEPGDEYAKKYNAYVVNENGEINPSISVKVKNDKIKIEVKKNQ